MKKALGVVVVGLALLAVGFAGAAYAQSPAPAPLPGNPADTFPAALGYAALAAATTVSGIYTAVVRHLWGRIGADAKVIEGLGAQHQTAVDTLRADHKDETDGLRERLEAEQRERREEVERLMREHKDIFRETLVTSGEIGQALSGQATAFNELRETVLSALVEEGE